MTTPPASCTPGTRLDPGAAHTHTVRCHWDLHHGGWRCAPPAAGSPGPDATTSRPGSVTR